MKYFTSDWHLNERRIGDFNPLFRPFKSIEEQNETIISNVNKIVMEDDILFHLGDVSMDVDGLKLLDRINCKNLILIKGNYDYLDVEYDEYFNTCHDSLDVFLDNMPLHLNHYPNKSKQDMFNIVGHIHSLWKVQPNMINVSVDAWHFKPVSEDEIKFTIDAIRNHYDDNVFPKLN